MTDTRYVVLLKGINVGRAKRMAMADLRALLDGLGYGEVLTHLQSGNAALTAAVPAAKVAAAIEAGLRADLGVEVKVVVRSHGQLAAAIEADPFADLADRPATHLLGFFSTAPGRTGLAAFEELVEAKHFDPDVVGQYRIVGDHCYLLCPQGVSKSLFAKVDWDRTLGVTVTMRNWTTALKLLDMSR